MGWKAPILQGKVAQQNWRERSGSSRPTFHQPRAGVRGSGRASGRATTNSQSPVTEYKFTTDSAMRNVPFTIIMCSFFQNRNSTNGFHRSKSLPPLEKNPQKISLLIANRSHPHPATHPQFQTLMPRLVVCSRLPSATSTAPLYPLSFILPCRSVSSVLSSPTTNLGLLPPPRCPPSTTQNSQLVRRGSLTPPSPRPQVSPLPADPETHPDHRPPSGPHTRPPNRPKFVNNPVASAAHSTEFHPRPASKPLARPQPPSRPPQPRPDPLHQPPDSPRHQPS